MISTDDNLNTFEENQLMQNPLIMEDQDVLVDAKCVFVATFYEFFIQSGTVTKEKNGGSVLL